MRANCSGIKTSDSHACTDQATRQSLDCLGKRRITARYSGRRGCRTQFPSKSVRHVWGGVRSRRSCKPRCGYGFLRENHLHFQRGSRLVCGCVQPRMRERGQFTDTLHQNGAMAFSGNPARGFVFCEISGAPGVIRTCDLCLEGISGDFAHSWMRL